MDPIAGAATNASLTTSRSSAFRSGQRASPSASLATRPTSALELRTRERLRLGDWYHVALTYDGSGKTSGFALYLNGARLDAEIVRDSLQRVIRKRGAVARRQQSAGQTVRRAARRSARLYDRALTPQQVEDLAIHHPMRVILSGVIGKPSKDDADRVRDLLPHVCGA